MDGKDSFLSKVEGLTFLFGSPPGESKNLQTILETIPSAVVLVNAKGRILYVNKRGRELYGVDYSGFDIFGHISTVKARRLDGSLFPLEELPVSQSLKSGLAVRNVEMTIQNMNGVQYPVNISSAPLYDNDGNISGAIVIFEDVTERKRAEEALHMSEERQEFLLKLSDAIRPLSDAKTIQDTATLLLSEHMGASQANYSEYHEDAGVATVHRENTNDPKIIMKGTYNLNDYSSSVAILRSGRDLVISDVPTFSEFPIEERERWMALNIRASIIIPLIKDGKLAVTLAVRNTTQRKWTPEEVELVRKTAERTWAAVERAKAEEALRESERKYRTVIETSGEGIVIAKPQGDYQYVNQRFADMLGYPADEILGKSSTDLSCSQEHDQVMRVRKELSLGDRLLGEFRFRRKDGTVLWTIYNATPVFNDAGEHMSNFVMHTDITERKKAEEALRESEAQARLLAAELEKKNRLVTDFFINISHEFKTPLTILMLGLELLEAKAKRMDGGGEAFLGNLTAIKQNSYRLNRLVANLLDITKLDAGFMQPKWENVEVVPLLGDLIKSVNVYAKQKKLTLIFSYNKRGPSFTTDSFMVERIMLNLLSNAIKHTPPGGSITVDFKVSENGIRISVKDTGEGIPKDKQATLFNRFAQVDTRMTRSSEGTGIGLALTKSLVELMGGEISVESIPGEGSTFTVKLPCVRNVAENGVAEKGKIDIDKRVQMEFSDIIGT